MREVCGGAEMHLKMHYFLSVSMVAFVNDAYKQSVLMDGVLEVGSLQICEDNWQSLRLIPEMIEIS